MSTLLKALRRADQPQFPPHIPAMGLPVSQEEEQPRGWIWWLLALLALVMGAAANYGWHLLNNRPIEKTVEVKEVVTPPFVRVEPKPMITRPLPPPPPEPVVIPKADTQPAPAPADSSQGLAERILNALNNTPLQQSAPPQVPAELHATPLSTLPPALRQQVPPLAYGAHAGRDPERAHLPGRQRGRPRRHPARHRPGLHHPAGGRPERQPQGAAGLARLKRAPASPRLATISRGSLRAPLFNQ